jgi:hypothetical protein
MLFGIAGGIGAGVFSFVYDKEDFASFFVAGRHNWQDGVAYLGDACRSDRPVIAKPAAKGGGHLRDALAEGRAWRGSTWSTRRIGVAGDLQRRAIMSSLSTGSMTRPGRFSSATSPTTDFDAPTLAQACPYQEAEEPAAVRLSAPGSR